MPQACLAGQGDLYLPVAPSPEQGELSAEMDRAVAAPLPEAASVDLHDDRSVQFPHVDAEYLQVPADTLGASRGGQEEDG